MKQEENSDKSNSNRLARNLEERSVGTNRKSPKLDLSSANNLTIEFSEN